jgi:hypothetical protein
MVLQPRCWVPCTPLVLPCSLRLVKRSLWGLLLCTLRLPVRLCRFMWFSPVICALRLSVLLHHFVWYYTQLWFCGRSEIESKSFRFQCHSPRHVVATTPLSGIKLLTRCLQQIILVARPTVMKIRSSQDLSLKRSLSIYVIVYATRQILFEPTQKWRAMPPSPVRNFLQPSLTSRSLYPCCCGGSKVYLSFF